MDITRRYLHKIITADLSEKMVFIGGPRQVGKTTLARFIGEKEYQRAQYLSWDNRNDRKDIIEVRLDATAQLIIFDELHKYRKWKNHLKGIFDSYRDRFHILVTGSARLDLYMKGGDSLLGRYHYFRLHPFSVAELIGTSSGVEPPGELMFSSPARETKESFEALLRFGGFPEPLFKQDERTLRRWQNERLDRLVKEDIRDIESIRDLSALQILVEILPSKVGSKLSLNALRDDLQVAHKTISVWMNVLERFYYHFRIYPFASRAIHSLRKEPKLYLWDWSQLEDEAARFENMVASHLFKFAHFLRDAHGYQTDLFYVRDVEGREIDFLVAVNKKPWFAVEVKESNVTPSKHFAYFAQKLHIPFMYQVVKTPNVDVLQKRVRVISADKFLSGLV